MLKFYTMQSLCLLFCLLSGAIAVPEENDFSHVITVDGSGISNSSCWYGQEPCTLELALEGAHYFKYSVMIIIQPGQYNLSNTQTNSFENTYDIAIIGNATSNSSLIVVQCLTNAGLSFVNVTSITIQDITFNQCGALHNSTSRNFMEPDTLPYLEFQAALYLLCCKDLYISRITVTNSFGTGMAIYDTSGSNTIENSDFSGNNVSESGTNNIMPGGGGLYIEFSYCIPGDMSCGTGRSNISAEYVSNSTYEINNCTFNTNNASDSTIDYLRHYYFYHPGNNTFTFGNGGGLAILFNGNAANNCITISSCRFNMNTARIGGGLYCSFSDYSHNNKLDIRLSNFTANRCFQQEFPPRGASSGGGVAIDFFLYDDNNFNNQVHFNSCDINTNIAYYGGGIAVRSTSVLNLTALTNTINFTECDFSHNIARTGSAVDIFHWFSIKSTHTTGLTAIPSFHNCNFTSNGGRYHYTGNVSQEGRAFATVYIQAIPTSFSGSTMFYNNSGSGIVVRATCVQFAKESKTIFTKNRSRIGGAMSILGDAWMVVDDGVQMTFSCNNATEKGGAISFYQIEKRYLGYSHTCFIRHINPYREPDKWNCSFVFYNNYAFEKRNSIHASSLLPCLWPISPNRSIGYDISKTFCWKGWIYNSSITCSDEILTSPVKFRAIDHNLNFFPGRPRPLMIQAIDENHHDITNQTVLTLTSHDKKINPSFLYVSDGTLAIKGHPNKSSILSLEAIDTIAVFTSLNISILYCLPGFVYDDIAEQCSCKDGKGFGELVQCDQEEFRSYIFVGSCISYKSNSSLLIAARCPFSLDYQESPVKIPLPNTTEIGQFCAKLNRTGTLCSKCTENYGIAAFHYTMKCVPCKNSYKNWLKYFALELTPLTLFFLVVFIFHIGITHAPANAFIFFSQVVSLPTFMILIETETKTVLQHSSTLSKALILSLYIPYSIWALETQYTVGASFCISTFLSGIHIQTLRYLSVVYPLLLAGIVFGMIKLHENNCRAVVCLCRPLCILFARFRRTWRPTTSVIDAFATFIVLAYTKLISVSINILAPVHVFNVTGEKVDFVMRYDPSAHFIKGNYIPFGILSILLLIMLGLLPPIVLLFYPFRWFQRFLNWSKLNSLALKTFVDAFQGCYKDGTDGTPDRRFFAGIYFLFRILIFTMYTFSDDKYIVFNYSSIVYMIATLCFIILQPYKQNFYNCLDATFMTLLAIISHQITYSIFNDIAVHYLPPYGWPLVYILMFIPSLYMVGFLVYKLATRSGLIKYCVSKCCKNRNIQWTHSSVSLSDYGFPHRITNPQLYEANLPAENDSDKEGKRTEAQPLLRPRQHAMLNYDSVIAKNTPEQQID